MSDNVTRPGNILMSAGDVCTLLDIKESTLRKYALLLIKHGYKFHENGQGQRGYFDNDVVVLRRFIEVKSAPNMTVEQAAKAVVSWVNTANMSPSVIEENDDKDRHNDDINELKDIVSKQNELIKELLTRMDRQQDYIEKRLDNHDKLLMDSLKESMETRKLLAAAQDEEKRKGFFAKLFGK